MADADTDRAILVMDADRDHRMFETRVPHSRHGEEQLTRKKARRVHPWSNDGLAKWCHKRSQAP
jgi:hypothetical protein